jgi:hypothetical protein
MYQDLLIAWKFSGENNMPEQSRKLRELIDLTLDTAILEREIQIKRMVKIKEDIENGTEPVVEE